MRYRHLSIRQAHGRCGPAALAAAMFAFVAPARAADFSVSWIGDFVRVASGAEPGERHLGLVEAGLADRYESDTGPVLQWQLTAQHAYGGGLSAGQVGDLQGVSNIDADPGTRLLEAWVDLSAGDAWSVRAGRYDLNSEFDAIEPAALFLSSSQGIGADLAQSGAEGPSIFPRTSPALRVQFDASGHGVMRAAVVDAAAATDDASGGPLWIVEYQHGTGLSAWRAGAWTYSGGVDAPRHGREYGGYASLERRLAPRLVGYLRLGLANPSAEQLGSYAGGGLVFEGLLPKRDDRMGLALGYARNGHDYRENVAAAGAATTAGELAIEATWRVPLGSHFALQPDVQYVVDPDTDPQRPHALVFILRVEACW